jgi:Mrp family chromosome partitioning ATPase
MAKDNSNANGDDSSADVHLVLNGKGGVGKSLVATWLAEFLISRGRSIRCIDGDPVNRSLSQYRALGAERLDLVNDDGLIQRARYDALIERFATTSGAFVVGKPSGPGAPGSGAEYLSQQNYPSTSHAGLCKAQRAWPITMIHI